MSDQETQSDISFPIHLNHFKVFILSAGERYSLDRDSFNPYKNTQRGVEYLVSCVLQSANPGSITDDSCVSLMNDADVWTLLENLRLEVIINFFHPI